MALTLALGPAAGGKTQALVRRVAADERADVFAPMLVLIPIREASGRRAAILAFPELLNIIEGRPVLIPPRP